MKTLQIMAGKHNGGAETAFTDTVCALHKAGIPQRAVVRSGSPALEILERAGVPSQALPFRNLLDFTTRPEIAHLIKEFQPDIVQTWMNRATRFCPPGEFTHVGWFGGYYDKKYYTRCDYLAGVTPDICKHQVAFGWPEDKVQVLRTFAPFEDVAPLPRADFDTPEEAPLLLSLSRLHWKKSIDIILQSLVDLPEAYLWIAGEGPLRRKLEKQARSLCVLDRVRFLGWRTDRAALLKTADVCVFPSRYEPFGTVVVEAWAARVPLVTAASAGPKAHVIDGENGLMIEIDDVAGLTHALRRVIEDSKLAQKLIENGWQAYQKDFTEEAVVQSYRAFYESLLGGQNAQAA